MKSLLLSLLCLLAINFHSLAQSNLQKIEIKGDTYTLCTNIPSEIVGKYLYEKKGEPIVELNADGTGIFQAHGIPGVRIKYWVDCDEKGVLRKREAANGRYYYTLVVQYLETSKFKSQIAGEYDLMGAVVAKDLGYVIILGERFKPL